MKPLDEFFTLVAVAVVWMGIAVLVVLLATLQLVWRMLNAPMALWQRVRH